MKTKDIAAKYNINKEDFETFLHLNQKVLRYTEGILSTDVETRFVEDYVALFKEYQGKEIVDIAAKKKEEEEKEKQKAEEKRKAEEKEAAEEKQRIAQHEEHDRMVKSLKDQGYDGYFEYTVLSLVDEKGGLIDTNVITNNLNTLGLQGWRLVCAYSNEIGHNSTSGGVFGISTGTNSTVDQNVLILERFVKL